MNIITAPLIFTVEEIEKIEAHYGAKYICESCVKGSNGWINRPAAIFYQADKARVPAGGSQWFGLFLRTEQPLDPDSPVRLFITNAVSCLEPFRGIVAENGDVIYSRYRHDMRYSPDKSVWIDGGRDYVRYGEGGQLVTLAINEDKLEIVQ